MSFGNEVVPGERTLLAHLSFLLMITRPRDAAQFRQPCTDLLIVYFRNRDELPRGEMPIHLIELIEIGQTFATYQFDRFFVFLPRLLRPLYNLSAFRTTALTCLKSPMRKLHSFARPTIIYRSTWWSLDGEVSIYHYRERSHLFRTFNLLSRFASFIDVARKHSCQCPSIDLAPF